MGSMLFMQEMIRMLKYGIFMVKGHYHIKTIWDNGSAIMSGWFFEGYYVDEK